MSNVPGQLISHFPFLLKYEVTDGREAGNFNNLFLNKDSLYKDLMIVYIFLKVSSNCYITIF